MNYKLADGSCSSEYKIGDEFKLKSSLVRKGVITSSDVVVYALDDRTTCPKFVLKGEDLNTRVDCHYEYISWNNLVPASHNGTIKKYRLLKSIGLVESGTPVFTKGTEVTIFGYTKVNDVDVVVIQDEEGGVTTCMHEYLGEIKTLEEKLKTTLWNDYNCDDTKGLIKDIKAGKVKGLKYVGE